jgi:anti-anti-sigma factor
VKFQRDDTDADVMILTADNRIDSFAGATVIDDLLREVDSGMRHVIVDCSQVGYMSSIGLTTLVRLHKRVSEREGQVKLVHVAAPLARLLAITRLQQVFPSYDTIEEARRAIREGSAAV